MQEVLEKKETDFKARFKAMKEKQQEVELVEDEFEYQDEDEDFSGILPDRNFRRNLGCGG